MFPVRFPEQNSVFRKDGCMDLPAYQEHNQEFNTVEVVSCWEFTDEECIQLLKEIKAGNRPRIFLSVIGGQPPVSLFMRDGDNNARDN